jgi:hypothetical protein
MATANHTARTKAPVLPLPNPAPVATIKAYRRKGGAIVPVERESRVRRYQVSLQRYHALREWLAFGGHPWKTSGAYLRSSVTASLWGQP